MSGSDRKDYRSLGEILRDAREAKGLRLEDVSESTKIAPKVLAALEKDQLDQVAGPLYARSFVRNLALFYGEEPEWLLSKLESAAPAPPRPVLVDPDEEEAPAPAAPRPAQTEPEAPEPRTTWRVEQVEETTVKRVAEPASGPPRWIWYLLAAVVAAVLIWLVLAGRGGSVRDQEEGVAEARTPPPAAEPATAGLDSTLESVGGRQPPPELPDPHEVRLRQVARTEGPAGPDLDATEEAPSTAAADPVPPAPENSEETAAAPSRRAEPPADPAAAPRGPGLGSIEREGVSPPVAGEVDLEIRALAPAEVEVQVDGGSWQRRRLPAGEVWTLTGRDHFSLRVDRRDAVRVSRDGEILTPPATVTGEWFIPALPVGDRD